MSEMGSRMKNLSTTAKVVIAVVILLLVGACSSSMGQSSDEPSVDTSSVTRTTKSIISAAKSPVVDLSDVELSPTTEVLEYSDKTIDPLTLVKCSNSDVAVSTKDVINLSRTGQQTVTYRLTLERDTEERVVAFTVRDTKSPTIIFSSNKASIQQGDAFDPSANIASVKDAVDGDLPRLDTEPEAIAITTQEDADRVYESGWYVVSSGADTASPGEYSVTVIASDIHGNRASRDYTVAVEAVAQEEVAAPVAAAPATSAYVLNTNTKKFHHPWCSSAKQMSAKNRQDVEATRDDVISWGYDPCQRCNP